MAASRKHKLVVIAYKPANEDHPVLQVAVSTPPSRILADFYSQAVRRADPGYQALYKACDGKPHWIYGNPHPLL